MDTLGTLKADQPYPLDYPQMPTDFRHTITLDWKWWLLLIAALGSGVRALTDGRTEKNIEHILQ